MTTSKVKTTTAKTKKTVTQAELSQLATLEAKCKALQEKQKALRESVRTRVLDGVPVEAGEYSIEITSTTVRQITHETLRRAVGQAVADVLIDAVPRTTRHVIRICNDESTAVPGFDPGEHPKHGEIEGQPRLSLGEILEQLAAIAACQGDVDADVDEELQWALSTAQGRSRRRKSPTRSTTKKPPKSMRTISTDLNDDEDAF